ncbi:hypothetical protein [Nocardia sp. NPDC051833]|uniref:hypothetical protein n=1 Tax=Nocardia sp. NPDC051833 TaxID=3155674 RepID=UPI0034375E2F
MPDRDIVDAIDELVDWQMSNYGNRSGYDHNINQATCPHAWCDADWHGLAITVRMRTMRRAGYVDPDYRYADDDSKVLCPGSEFEGEFTPPVDPRAGIDTGWGTFADTMRQLAAWHSEILGTWTLPDDPYDDNSSRGVLEMAEVDSLRGLRCQAGTPDAAYAEYLREHVRSSFFEEVASRYHGVQLDPVEIRTEYRQDGISRLVAWWEPDPVGGILEGGHAHGREVNANVGHRVETITPVIPTLTDFNNPPMSIDLPIVTYERAAYDTVTRRWVYRPRRPAPRATVHVRREGEAGWQELGALAEPIQLQPAPEFDDPALRFTPAARSFTATFDLADVHPDLVRLLQGDDNPADEPAEGDQAA